MIRRPERRIDPADPARAVARNWAAAGVRAAALAAASIALMACGDDGDRPIPDAVPAVPLWSQPEAQASIFAPGDMAATCDSIVWITETAASVVMRMSPPKNEYVMFGLGEKEPEQVVAPYLIAAARDVGVFVYDSVTRRIDLFTAGARFLRGFEPGFEVAAMTVTRDPIGLLLATTEGAPAGEATEGQENAPRLVLIHTNLRGEGRDTLLARDAGPGPLRGATVAASPEGASTIVAESARGVWVWTRSAPDTVYEVAPAPATADSARRLALEPDATRGLLHMLGDPERGLLWLVKRDTAGGGFRYLGFDVSDASPDVDPPTLSGQERFLAVGTTPSGFVPQEAAEGAVIGWRRGGDMNQYLVEAWRMPVEPGRQPSVQ